MGRDINHGLTAPATTEPATWLAAHQTELARLAAIAAIPCSFVAADWPGMAMLPGSPALHHVPGTADLIVDDHAVTVALAYDADERLPYVADAPEWLTIDQAERIDAVIAAAWATREAA